MQHLVTVEGISKVRRAQVRLAKAGMLPVIPVKDDKGKFTGAEVRPVYVSHKTTTPPVTFTRNTSYRRPSSPWKMRVPQKAGTTIITCELVPVPTVE